MTKDYTAIRVEAGAKEAAEQAKRDGETWSEYVLRCTDNPPEVREYVDANGVADIGPVTLDASERRRIAEEVVEVLQG